MKSILFINKNGAIKDLQIETNKINKDMLIESFGIRDSLEYIGSWKVDNYHYVLYSHNDGKAGRENKYELPPPLDSILLFNEIIIVKCKQVKKNTCSKLENLSPQSWKHVYNKLYGGMENIDQTDDESESLDDEEDMDEDVSYTKSGYVKDGFVVSDTEYDSEYDDEYKNNELVEEDYDTE